MPDATESSESAARLVRIQHLLDDCIERRLAGRPIADEQLIADHPDLLPELAEELAHLDVIERARRRFRAAGDSSSAAPTRIAGTQPTAPGPPDFFPGYEIRGEIQRGGQGVVYRAVQESTGREVAIKVARGGALADERELIRFEREVQILGTLQHPRIVAIHDSGVSPVGSVYYVMDYVEGRPLDRWITADGWRRPDGALARGASVDGKGAKSQIRAALRFFVKICEGVTAAHLRGVIHRDLKPSNILVDAEGEPHILDFGLAKVASSAAAGEDAHPTQMTMTGQFLGSLPWAAPEQAEGQPAKIDVRTDVYALGVILYQLLTGRFPYDVTGTASDVAARISRTEPARPSTLRREIDDEIQTIILKALSKERERRYQTAGELARDIQHYLAGEPIEAKRDSGWYVLKKTLRRYRLQVTSAAAFALVVAAGLAISLVLWQQAVEQRDRAELEAERAKIAALKSDEVARFTQEMLAGVNPDYARDMDKRLLRLILDNAAQRIETELADQPDVAAALQATMGDTYRAIGEYAAAERHLDEALRLRRAHLGDDHPDTLSALAALGLLLTDTGDYENAMSNTRAALDGRRGVLGGDDPETLASINNMGYLLATMGELDQAEPYYREALERRRAVLGDDHLDTLGSISNMAYLSYSMGRLNEAEQYWNEALAGYRRVSGDNHPRTLLSLNNMGMLLKARGKLTEAEEHMRAALEGNRHLLGDEHPQTLLSLNNMGHLLAAMGKLADAEPYCREAYETRRRVLGEEHPLTLGSLHNLADLLRDLGRLNEAETLAAASVRIARRALPANHVYLGIFLANHGTCLTRLDRYGEAESTLHEAHAALAAALGLEHERTAKLTQALAELYDAWHAAEPGQGYDAKAAEWRAKLEAWQASTQPAEP